MDRELPSKEVERFCVSSRSARKSTRNYDISDLHTDSDRVACVASRCRSVAGELIREIFHRHINDGWIPVEDEKKPGEYETVGEI